MSDISSDYVRGTFRKYDPNKDDKIPLVSISSGGGYVFFPKVQICISRDNFLEVKKLSSYVVENKSESDYVNHLRYLLDLSVKYENIKVSKDVDILEFLTGYYPEYKKTHTHREVSNYLALLLKSSQVLMKDYAQVYASFIQARESYRKALKYKEELGSFDYTLIGKGAAYLIGLGMLVILATALKKRGDYF